MIDIQTWTRDFLAALDAQFGARVWFAGLQGSYARGEATEDSDIDMVVILDRLSPEDITAYGQMLDRLPHRNKQCGFLAGLTELEHWDKADLFQLAFDTVPLRGSLEAVRARLDSADVRRAVHLGACGIHHVCVHNLLHGREESTLRGLYKQAGYLVQAIHYLDTGRFIARQADLLPIVDAPERAILQTGMDLRAGQPVRLQEMSEALLSWAQRWVVQAG